MTTVTARARLGKYARLLIATLIIGSGLVPAISSVVADPGDPEYLILTKGVDDETPEAGQTFTYTVTLSCSEAEDSCTDAVLIDQLPAELAGFPIVSVSMTPSAAAVPRTVTWTEAGTPVSQPSVVGAATAVTVDFDQPIPISGATGLVEGTTFTMLMTLRVPDDLAPGTYSGVNRAEATASNAAPVDDGATVTVDVPVELAVTPAKTWTPASQPFNPGAPSQITVGATNSSNTGVDQLVIQEPAVAVDGSPELHPSNPFTIADFSAFGASTLPAGAASVQVDAYVFNGTIWHWVSGSPGPTPMLPAPATPMFLGGMRFIYQASSPGSIPPGATVSQPFTVTQRSTHRNNNADMSASTTSVLNQIEARVALEGHPDATAAATANHTVQPASIGVEASKNITPERISAGGYATATIGALNESDLGATELRLSDLGYFTNDVRFGGFDPLPYPTGATAAHVVFHHLDGGSETVPFLPNGVAFPADPGELISGFEIVYSSPAGTIAPDAGVNATFRIFTTESAASPTLTTNNTVTARVTAVNGATATSPASDGLVVVAPAIDVTLDKTILPDAPVLPGEEVVISLDTDLTTSSDYVTADRIVVEDAWDGDAGDFWDAFDVVGIGATQVPAGATLTIEFDNGGAWVSRGPYVGPTIVSLTAADLPAPTSSLAGVRFTFTDADGFAAATTVTPYVVARARTTLRSGGPVTAADDTPVVFENLATVTGSGKTGNNTPLTDSDDDDESGSVVTVPGGPGPFDIDKEWSEATVVSQSGHVRGTDLDWHVAPGAQTVTITDTADPSSPANPSGTVFQAFDLRSIRPVPASNTPYTNGWFLKYDTITSVELYRAGAWTTLPVPAGGWVNGGRFVGYDLDAAQSADTTGIRIVVAPNDTARIAARQAGPAYDPYAPLPGSGVASGSVDRTFTLHWNLRNTVRDGSAWVTRTETYNAGAGLVENAVRLTVNAGLPGEATGTAADTIQIIDTPPGVDVTKTVVTAHDPTPVPYPGSTPAADYPTATYTITASNTSVGRASYVRVTDPPSCTDSDAVTLCATAITQAGATGDPFTAAIDWLNPTGSSANPFDRYDLTGIGIAASLPDEVDMAATTVWLLLYDEDTETYSTVRTTADAVSTLSANFPDVVGVSVTFQDTDPSVDGGSISTSNDLTITLQTRLRTHLRSSGAVQELAAGQSRDVTNRVVAQSYDPVANPTGIAVELDDVDIELSGGVINVASTKSVNRLVITEPQRDDPVIVSLGANQGASPRSTLSPAQVTVVDDVTSSPDFWDRFELRSLNGLIAPAGADRVAIDVYGPYGPGGALDWTTSASETVATAQLPAVDLTQVQGVRFTWTRDDGAFFSNVLPAPNWSTTSYLVFAMRDTLRSSGDAIDFAADVVVTNTVTAKSDRLNGEASGEHRTTRSMTLTPGTQELSVRKLTNGGVRSGAAGETYPFDLTFSNTGSGYLTVTEVRDTLPANLVYTGAQAPEFTPDPDGLLGGDVTLTLEGADLVFTWPDDASTMLPGETFTIRVWLEMQPTPAGTQVTNTMVVTTEEPLDSCSHLASGTTTGDWADDDTTCGTTDYIQPIAGANLFTVKGVRGSEPGAGVANNPAWVCSPTLVSGADSYYRAPCVANSVVTATDHWLNRVQNVGTVDVTELTMFDQLPSPVDTFLVTGADRGSQYRPQIVGGSIAVTAPAGTAYRIDVTTSSAPCVGTWANLTTQAVCEQNGEAWTVANGATDWSAVTGFRVVFDFSSTSAGALASGDVIDVKYDTTNVVADATTPDGSFAVVPAADQVAWNQFGVKHRFGTGGYSKLSPSRVGVHLMTGPIQIDKVITGAGTAYAADEFLVDVACDVDGTALDMGASATVTLNAANSYSARIDGIPIGADCTFSEQGALGAFGESGRNVSPTTLSVDSPATVDGDVPAAQIQTITNSYAMTDLSVTKLVDTDAVDTDLGPFSFALSCVSLLGDPNVADVDFGAGTTLTFDLEAGGTWSTPDDSIPVGATCTLTETDADLADGIVIAGPGVTDNGNGSATIVASADPALVTVSNRYDSGEILVSKTVAGPAAVVYGTGPFGFSVDCVYDGQTVLDDFEFDLVGGQERKFGPYPTGTVCEVAEDGTVGEFGETTRTGTPATLTITDASAQDGTVPAAQVAAVTNTFEMSGLSVAKVVDTDAVDTVFGPFDFELTCETRIGQGVLFGADDEVTFSLSDGALVAVPPNTIPVGSTCTLTETDDDLADDVVFSGTGVTDNGDGTATVAVGDDPVAVTVTNHYDSGEILVTKVVDGPGATAYGAGPFGFSTVCTYDGQPVLDVTFDLVDGDERRFGPYASGTECVVTEDGDVGDFGETSRTGTPITLTITDETAQDGTIPAAQVATVTNTFDMTELSVTKVVDTDAVDTDFGPFEFELTCVSRIGQDVLFGADTSVTFELEDGGTWTTPDETIPVGSTCELTETGADAAHAVVIGGDDVVATGVTADGAATATVAVGDEPVAVAVVNRYEAGALVVAKVVDGPGADEYGDGPFGFTAVCEYGDQTVLDVDFELGAGESADFGPFVTGTECTVDEVDDGGAATSAISSDGVVTTLADGPATVTATNTFELPESDVLGGGGSRGPLAWTGSNPARLVFVGVAAVVAGAALVLTRRRRHS